MSAISTLASGGGLGSAAQVPTSKQQRVCCLALCGIHLGPFAYLQKSSLVMPYIQVRYLSVGSTSWLMKVIFIKYFESEATTELFEFQVCSNLSIAGGTFT